MPPFFFIKDKLDKNKKKKENAAVIEGEKDKMKKQKSKETIRVTTVFPLKMTASSGNLRPWCDLPRDLLEGIMKTLCPADQIRMRSVSKRWRQLPPQDDGLLQRLPWFAAPRKNFYKHMDAVTYDVYSPINNLKPYTTQMITGAKSWFSEAACLPCKHGWLAFLREKEGTGEVEILLFRPTTKQIVVLPNLSHGIQDLLFLTRVFTFSSDPDSDGCTFFAHYSDSDYSRKAITSTYRQGDEEGWITNVFSGSNYKDEVCVKTNAVYYQGGFYYASWCGVLVCYRVADQKWYSLNNPELDYLHYTLLDTKNLVVPPSGELLLVCLDEKRGGNCHLFAFNWTVMRWDPKFHLKDQALFLGSHLWDHSFAIHASGYTANLANKIFFYSYENNATQYYDINEGEFHDCKDTEFDCFAIKERNFVAAWIEAQMVETRHSESMDKLAHLLAERPKRLTTIFTRRPTS